MLPQLVGMSCAACQQRIGSEIDGRFCEGCGNPVHDLCAPQAASGSNDELLTAHENAKCSRCGCAPMNPIAVEVRYATLARRFEKEVAPVRGPAEMYNWWKLMSGVCALGGVIAILLGGLMFVKEPDPARPNSDQDDRNFGYLSIFFGVFLLAFGAFCGWLQSMAARRFQQARDENEKPPG
jgi:hypothetical protein